MMETDFFPMSAGHFREWPDIQHVYDLIANDDVNILDTCDILPEFNEDLIDVFSSSFDLPPSPLLPTALDELDTNLEPADCGLSQLKQLLLTKPNVQTDIPWSQHSPTNVSLYSTEPDNRKTRAVTAPTRDGTHGLNTTANNSSLTTESELNDIKSKPAQKTLKFPPCFICGGKASGLHYGVNSCEACKGFFRRYLIRNEEYKCPKGGNCQIVNRNRENCSGCRLQKCFELGMSKEKSKLGRYTLSRRTETIKKVKALEKKESKRTEKEESKSTVCSDISQNFDHNYSETTRTSYMSRNNKAIPVEEFSEKLVNDLVKAMDEIKPYGAEITTKEEVDNVLKYHYRSYKNKIEVYGAMKSVPKEEYYKLLKEYGIDVDGRMKGLRKYVREIERVTERYCNFAKLIPGFKRLPRKDQSTLLKADRCDFFLILMNEGYNEKYKTVLSRSGVPYHVEEISDKHFSRDLISKVCETYLRWQKLDLRKQEKALIIAMTLFFTDRCNIEDIMSAEKIQLSLADMLREQLEKIWKSQATRRFTKIVDCLTFMRESSEMYFKEYKQLCNDETVVEAVPMLTEFLVEDW